MSCNVLTDEQLPLNGIWRFSLKCVVPSEAGAESKVHFCNTVGGVGLTSRVMLLHIQNLLLCWQPQQRTPKMC